MVKNLYPIVYSLLSYLWKGESNRLYRNGVSLLILLMLGGNAVAQISGTVYRDFNNDGVRSFTATSPLDGEIGVGGVTVTVYSGTAVVATTTTSSASATAGQFSISTSATGPFRVVFTNLPAGYFAGRVGTNSGTTVQFAPDNTTANLNLGINYPSDYCQASPNFIVPCYVNGDPQSTTATSTTAAANQPVLVTLPYSATSGNGNAPSEVSLAQNSQLGAVYGVAYQRATKYVFTSAFVKRHSGLGTGGPGAIYITKPTGTTLFATIPNVGTVASNSARGLPGAINAQNRDVSVFGQVGKTGLGDMEISEDGTELYVVNLFNNQLYRVPILNANTANPTAGTPVAIAIPTPTQTAGSVFRSFGLKYYRGRVYVGGVTTNEAVSTTVVQSAAGSSTSSPDLITRSRAGMLAAVYEYNPETGAFNSSPVLSFPLTYTRGAVNNDKTGIDRTTLWYPWTDVQPGTGNLPNRFVRADLANCSYPQPWFAGIEFDVDGSMIISIRDRFGDQYGNNNLGTDLSSNQLYRAIAPGDILRAGRCNPATNVWTLESNASVCGGAPTAGANNGQGPGNGEYYFSDAIAPGDLINGVVRPYHAEMSEGGLAMLPGSGEVASIVLDPTTNIDAGGIRRFNNADGSGSVATSVQIYQSSNVATYGKANGLGDLELNCDVPPIEIGNRLFNDGDFLTADGIQGNNQIQSNVSGATVLLYRVGNATPVASTTTNSNGEYYFNNTNVTGGLLPNTAYEIRVALNQFATPTTVTRANIGTDDLSDSDGLLQTISGVATAVVSLTTGDYGENNHSYDIGFIRAPATIGDFVFEDLNRNGIQDTGEPGLAGVTVQLLDANGNPVAGVASVTTTATGFYSFTGLTPATPYIIAFTQPTGYTATLADQGANDAIDSDVNPTTGRTISYTVASGASLTTVDAGFYRSASIGDRVFVDANRNGIQDAGELGLAGVPVQLLTGANTVVASTTTNASGIYSFTGLTPAVSYSVVFGRPSSYLSTSANVGANDAVDSDADPITGRTIGYTLTSGQSLTTVDAGFYLLNYDLALRKTVLSQPAPLLPLSNVTFRIEVFNQGELPASGIVVTDYVPAGFVFAQASNPGWSTGPNPTFPISGTISPGASTTISIVLQVGALSGGQSLTNAAEISTDDGNDLDSTPDNIANNDGTVTDDAIANQNGDQDDHDIAVVNALAFASLGDFVFEDLNANGVQDAGDVGINGVTVQLLTGTTSVTVINTTTTNASGLYSFTGLTPGVSYSVAFGRPSGYSATVANAGGNDGTDSDADPVTGRTGAYVLAAGENNTTVDAGFYRTASLGDFVFADNNRNGIQDTGEPGIPGVTVQLLTGTNTVVASTTTNASGSYSFTGLTPGVSYSVVFTRPAGYTSVVADQGGNDLTDSDADPTTGRTGSYTLASNGSNLTVDAGFSCIPPVVTATGGALSCTLTTVQLQATSSITPSTFAWTGPGGFTSTLQNPTVGVAGTYTVVVTSNAGCSATAVATAIVTQNVTLPGGVAASNTGPLTCTLTTAVISGTSTTAGVTYRWVGPNGFTSTAQSFSTSIAGTYSLTVTGPNGCTNTASTTLQQDIVAPTKTATNTGPLTCTLTTVTVSASSTEQVTYRWSGPGSFTTTAQSFSTSIAGTYSVTVTAANGCTATTTTDVQQNLTAPTLSANNTGPLTCTLTSVTVSATANEAVTYRWTGPGNFTSTAQSFTTSVAGIYSVTATSANGCTAVTTTTVQQNAVAPTVTASNSGPLSCTLTNVTVSAAASAGVSYLWSNGQTTASFSTSIAGTYSVTVTSANGCTATASTTVIQNITPPAGVAASNTGPLTCTLTTATVSVSSTTAGVTYRWVGPGGFTSTAQSFNTSVAGLYSVTVTSANGCTATASTALGQDITPPAGVTATNNGPLTCAQPTATVSASSTTAGVSYLWSNGQTTASFSTSIAGTYSVTVTSANGCTATASTTVIQNITPPAGVAASNTGPLTCTLTTATVSVSSTTAGVTYRWVGPGGFTSTAQSFNTSVAGLYSVTVTSANGCTATASTALGQDITPPAGVTATNNGPLTCAQPTATVSASSTTAGVSYLWSNGQTTASFSTSIAGTYSVTVTSANGCTATASTTVIQNITPPADVVASNNGPLTCTLTTATVGVSTSTSGVTYSWVGPGGFTSTAQSFNTSVAGLYSVTVTSANGCTATASTTVIQNIAPPTGVAASNTGPLTCTLVTVTVSASSTTAGVTYRWAGPGGFVSTAQSFPTSIAGVYSVTVTNPVNGCTTTATTTVIQNTTPPAGVLASNTGPLTCTQTTATVSVTTTTAGATYRWAGPGGFTSTAASFSTSVAGTYSVTVTAPNGCTTSSSTTLQQNVTAPTVTATNTGPLTCTLTSVSVSATANEAVSYRWSTGATTASISVSVAGTYSVTVTNANGCTATTSSTVQQNLEAPTLTATNTGPLTCTLTSVSVSATANEAVSYRWNIGVNTASFTTSIAGLYSVTATSANGCTAVATTTVQQDLSVPTVTASNTGPLTCTLTSVTVSANSTPGVTYRWSNGQTTASFSTSIAGTYSVTVTSANGCTATASTTVGQDTTPPAGVVASNNGPLNCAQATATVSVTSSTAGVLYSWTGPGGFTATAQSFTTNIAGTYSVTATAANGCTTVASTNVIQNTTPLAGVAASNTGPLTCTLVTATVSATSTTPGVTYSWTGPGGFTSTAQSFTTSIAGTYQVTVSGPNGCAPALVATTVGQDVTPPAGVAASNTGPLSCTLSNVTVSASSSTPGVTYRWVGPGGFVSTSQSFATAAAGLYSVTVTSPNGCTAGATTTVGQDNTGIQNITISNTGPLNCTLTTVTVNASTSTPGVTYRWVGPNGFTSQVPSFATSTAGTYSLTLSAPNGCTAATSTTVLQDIAVPAGVLASNTGPLTCTQTTATVSVTTTTAGTTYRWVGPGGFTSTAASFTTGTAGTYSVTLTGTNGCTATASTVLGQDIAPPAGVVASNTGPLTCTQTTATVSATSTTAGVIYSWVGPGGFASSAQSFATSVPGTYSVTITNTANGCTTTASTTVGQNVTPPAGVTATNNGPLSCTLTTVTVSASSTTPGVTYRWAGPGGFTSTAASFSTNVAGLYSVTITSANGCTAVTTTTVQQNLTAPTVTATNTGPLTCTLTTATVSATVTAAGPVTYLWSNGQTTASFSTSLAGTYSVTVTSANGCTATASTTIQIDQASPTVTASNTGPLTCTLTSVNVSATTNEFVTYLWSNGQTTASFSTSIAGTYSVTVTSANGCTAIASTTVQQNVDAPSATIGNTSPLSCTQTTVTLTEISNVPVTYRWSTGATTASISVSVAGPYSVTVTAANGCTAVATTNVVSDTAVPTVTATVSNTLTVNQPTATISTVATLGVSYLWNTGATTPSISVSAAGTYSVTVTAPNGCTAATTATVVSDTAAPTVTASVSNTLTCAQTTATISTTANPVATYLWNTGANTASIVVSVAGTYSVTVTAPNGATAATTATVVSNTVVPTVTASVSNTLTCTQPT
ncbi:SdrD B-like domain-containing protein, partial [Spirosoma soli]